MISKVYHRLFYTSKLQSNVDSHYFRWLETEKNLVLLSCANFYLAWSSSSLIYWHFSRGDSPEIMIVGHQMSRLHLRPQSRISYSLWIDKIVVYRPLEYSKYWGHLFCNRHWQKSILTYVNWVYNVFFASIFMIFAKNSHMGIKTLQSPLSTLSNFYPSFVLRVLSPKRKINMKIKENEANDHFEVGLVVSLWNNQFCNSDGWKWMAWLFCEGSV